MANALTQNPMVIDTAGATSLIQGPLSIKAIQWVDDNADIADNDDLVFVIDNATITVKVQLDLSNPVNGVAYEINFGGNAFGVSNKFSVTTIDHGQLLIWLE